MKRYAHHRILSTVHNGRLFSLDKPQRYQAVHAFALAVARNLKINQPTQSHPQARTVVDIDISPMDTEKTEYSLERAYRGLQRGHCFMARCTVLTLTPSALAVSR